MPSDFISLLSADLDLESPKSLYSRGESDGVINIAMVVMIMMMVAFHVQGGDHGCMG